MSVALGCGNFGGVGSAPAFFGQGIEHDEAFAIMDRAWEAGITWFDTGDAYGGGTSERWIGEWIRERGAQPKLTTKVFHSTTGTPGDTGLAPDRVRRQIRASLERLGVDHVDYYLAHEPDAVVPLEETIVCFESLRDEGLIRAWGLSNYKLAEIRATSPSLVQNSFSLLERADEGDVLPHCRERGIPYIPFGPLAGGWLTGKYRRGEAFPEGSRMTQRPGPYERFVDDQVFDGLDALGDEAASRGVSMAGLAFAWVTHRCDGAVCGPNRATHLDPVLEAMHIDLTNEDVERIGGFFQ
ncbi:MAG TPA: aldo/keto reductase [Gaiellaceae bacterium]|jgi:aryl-alcohol dehydrogenase-like predicted oxidoreductase